MNIRKYIGLAILIMSFLTSCNTSITSKAITQTKPAITKTIGPPKTQPNEISIGTYNIQTFGKAKREKENIITKLADIADDYDILAVQEIKDKEEKTATYFLEKINAKKENNYSMIVSPRTGRTAAKEQYAFYYNNQKIEYMNESYMYPDEKDKFEREPYIAYFKTKNGNFDFILVNVHTQPKNATQEINSLTDVIKYIQNKNPTEKDIIILGDLNADGHYYNEKNTKQPLEQEKYFWAIPDNFDTTTAKTSNTYDRIIFLRENTLEDYTKKSGIDKYYKRWTGINFKELSDHYPVWAKFYTNKDTD